MGVLPVFGQNTSIDYDYRSTNPRYVALHWDTAVTCNQTGIGLTAHSVVTTQSFNGTYSVESIPCSPPFEYYSSSMKSLNVTVDDRWSPTVHLPFTFCFFGSEFDYARVGSNGVVQLCSSAITSTTEYCSWSFSSYLPIPSTSFPIKNAIYGVYEDMNPSYNTGVSHRGIYWDTAGTYPNRAFCATWYGIGQYGHQYSTSIYNIYEIVLYEGTNVVDIYVNQRKCCPSTNSGLGVIGIQNAAGTSAFYPTGWNYGRGSTSSYYQSQYDITTPVAWRFTPQGSVQYTVRWYQGTDTTAATGHQIGTGDSIFVSPTTPTTYTARLSYHSCGGLDYDLSTQIVVGIDTCTQAAITNSNPSICTGQTSTLGVEAVGCSEIGSVDWSTGQHGTSIEVTPTAATTYTALVHFTNGCTRQLQTTVIPSSTIHQDIYQSICEGSTYPFGGQNYGTAGTYQTTSTSHAGCDSVTVLHLSVNEVDTVVVNDTITDSQLPWHYGGLTFNDEVKDRLFFYANQNNCDSVVKYSLYIHRRVNDTIDSTICENRLPFTWNGHTFIAAGSYTTTLIASNGADSVLMMVLHVIDTVVTHQYDTICDGEQYQVGNMIYIQQGDYPYLTQSADGCDSMSWLHLTVNSRTSSTVHDTITENDLPWRYGGMEFNGAVTNRSVHLTNAAGCDSAVNYSLFVYWNVAVAADSSICEGQLPFVWNGVTFTAAGTDTATLHTRGGADSVVAMTVTVRMNSSSNAQQSVVENALPIVFNGITFNDSVTNYPVHLTNAAGCDSIVYFTLNVSWNGNAAVDSTVCDDQIPLTWNGVVFTETDRQTVTLRSAGGADSVLTMRVFVNKTYDHHFFDTICQGGSVDFAGRTFTAANAYEMNLFSVAGCDSTVTLHLTVNPNTQSTISETIVENQLPWRFNDMLCHGDTVGVTVHVENRNGCDSAITYTLHVYWNDTTDADSTICESALPLQWNGRTFNSAGYNWALLHGEHGEDSLVRMHVYVEPEFDTTVYDTICQGRESWKTGTPFWTTGIHTAHFHSVAGCDSAVHLALWVKDSSSVELCDSIVENDLPWAYENLICYGDTANAIVRLSNAAGCDSIVHYCLTVHRNVAVSEDSSACSFQLPFEWNGVMFESGGTQTATLHTIYGADSVVTMTLRIRPNSSSTVFDTVMENQLPYDYHGYVFNDSVSGTQVLTQNAEGCDSVITYSLFVHWNASTRVDSTICEGSLPLVWNGCTFNAAGVQRATLHNGVGADSLVTMTVIVNPQFNVDVYDTICYGESYTLGDNVFSASGNYTVPLTSVLGCDSVVNLHLVIRPEAVETVTESVVENALPHVYGGVTFNDEVTDTVFHFVSRAGCDSMVHYTLRIYRNVVSRIQQSICERNLPLMWNGVMFTEAGSDTIMRTTRNGADSMLIVTLHVNPDYIIDTTVVICQGDVVWFGFTGYTDAGTYTHRTYTRAGCDSTLRLTLIVNDTDYSTHCDTIVENQLQWMYGGVAFGDSHADTLFHFQNAAGCDSSVSYCLTVFHNVYDTIDMSLCENSLPLAWNGSEIGQAGSYTVVLPAHNGADSVVTLNLEVRYNTQYAVADTANENLLPVYFNGVAIMDSVTDTVFHLTNAAGCDSLLHYSLYVHWNSQTRLDSTICDSRLPLEWNGHVFYGAGIWYDTLTTIAGADSVVMLRLSVNPTYGPHYYDTICEGSSIQFAGHAYTLPGTYPKAFQSVAGCDSVVTLHLVVNANSTHTVADTIVENQLPWTFRGMTCHGDTSGIAFHLSNAQGCDSTIYYSLFVYRNVSSMVDSSICASQLPFMWSGVQFTQAGIQMRTLHDRTGADSVVTMRLTVNPDYSVDVFDTICQGQSAWFFGNALTAAGNYSHMLASQAGCDSLVNYHLAVNNISLGVAVDTIVENQLPWTADNGLVCHGDTSQVLVVLTNAVGCDSLLRYTLIVHHNVAHTSDSVICENQLPLRWNGVTFTDSDTRQVLLTAHTGADSLETMQVTVLRNSSSVAADTVNENQLPVVFNGVSFNDSVTNATVVIPNAAGCDSVITYSLFVNWNVSTAVDSTVCASELPLTWNGVVFNDADRQVVTLHDRYGADSLVTMRLFVNPTYQHHVYDTICDGGQSSYCGNNYSVAGAYPCNLQSALGCDSTVTFHLVVKANTAGVFNDTIVQNSLPHVFRGTTFRDSASGVEFHLTNAAGCDSTLTYSLFVHRNVTNAVIRSICASQLPFTWNGVTFTQAGSQTITLRARSGADSVLTMLLRVNPDYTIDTFNTVCEGDVVWFGNTGYTSTGEYVHRMLTRAQCDSVLRLHLTVNQPTQSVVRDTVVENQLPRTFNGVTFNADHGDTVFHLLNALGCDSAITYSLFVHRNVYDTIDSLLCESEFPFTWNGIYFVQGGSFTLRLTSSTGADSLLTMRVVMLHNSSAVVADTVNENWLPIYYNGVPFYDSITDTVFHLTNAAGCDSVIHYSLYVNWNTSRRLDSTICDNQLPLVWKGHTFMSSGIQYDTLTSSLGTDSIVMLRLIVNPTYGLQVFDTICDGQLCNFGGQNYSYGGSYPRWWQSQQGCDSVVTLRLTVKSNSALVRTDTIVENQLPWTFNGNAFNTDTAGVVYHLTNAVGCDSAITYGLYVYRNVSRLIDSTICASQLPLLWNGVQFTQAGVQVLRLSDQSGADSVVTMQLIVHPVYNVNVGDTVCQGTAVPFGNSSYSTTGNYTHVFASEQGCDSTVTLRLLVKANTSSRVADTIVENQLPWHFNGMRCFSDTSQALVHLENRLGCDSTIDYSLFVHRNVAHTSDSVICENQLPLLWNGATFLNSGTQQAMLIAHTGADSLETMRLTVLRNSSFVAADTVNENQLPIVFNGVSFNDSVTNATVVIPNAAGCDSVITYSLYVNWNVTTAVDSTICASELPLTWNGVVFNDADRQVVTLHDHYGADSLVTMRLYVNPTYQHHVYDTICDGGQSTYCGNAYSVEGMYPCQLQSVLGCDSIVNFHLAVKANTVGAFHDTIVQNSLPHVFMGTTFRDSVSGVEYHLTNAVGCDSTLIYSLFVHRNVSNAVIRSICASQLPFTWNGVTFTQAGTQTITLRARSGADSVLTMLLRVNPEYTIDSVASICQGDVVWFNRTGYSEQGTYTHRMLSSAGCDSVIQLHLTVNDHTQSVVHDTIVENQLPHTFNGVTFLTDHADTVFHLANAAGCDSAITYSLFVYRNVYDTVDSLLCEDFFPLQWNGHTFNQEGQYQAVLQAATGADSILLMRVAQLANSTNAVQAVVGESSLPYFFNGVMFADSVADTVFHLVNAVGCDSLLHFSLHVNWNASTRLDSVICDSQLPFLWNGHTFLQSGVQYDTIRTASQADSIVILRLTVNPTYSLQYFDTICEGEVYTFTDVHYEFAGSYPRRWTSAQGCDSVVTLRLAVNANTSAVVADTIVENQLPWTYHGSSFLADTSNVVFHLVNSAGCDSTITYSLFVYHNISQLIDSAVCESLLPLQWDGHTFNQAGIQVAYLTDHLGADSIVTMRLTVYPEYDNHIYDTICYGDTIVFGHNAYTTEGTFPQNFNSIHGCDSLATLHLAVNPISIAVVADTIVENRLPWSFLQYQFLTDTSLAEFHLTNAYGCDSTIEYSLYVHRNVTASADSVVCSDALPIMWNGVSFGQQASQSVTLTAHTGADSVLTMNLIVHFTTSSVVNMSVVENDLPVVFNGVSFNDSVTNYPVHLVNSAGCDSTILFSLSVSWNGNAAVDSTICQSQLPIIWNGVTFTEAGRQVVTLTDHLGADSVLTMRLFVNPTFDIHLDDTICQSQTAVFCDSAFSESGAYPCLHSSVYGCDSLVTLHLVVNPNTAGTYLDTVVQNNLPHSFLSQTFADSVTGAEFHLTNAAGCDSTLSYSLFVHRNVTGTAIRSICSSQLPLTWNGVTFEQGGTQTITLRAHTGADSVLTMLLRVNPEYTIDTIVSICNGDVVWFGYTGYSEQGVYTHRFTTRAGCDSVLRLHLSIHDSSFAEVRDTIVENALPYSFNGVSFASSHTDTLFHLTNAYGCDSLLTFSLFVYPNVFDTVDSLICNSQLPLMWHGVTFNQAGTQTVTLAASSGADSVLTMRLGVNYNTSSVVADTVNENLLPYIFNGVPYIDSVLADTVIIPNSVGCDSIITFSLVVNHNVSTRLDSTVCSSQLPVLWNGHLFSQVGVCFDTLSSATGADSLVMLRLFVNPAYTVSLFDTICPQPTYSFADTSFAPISGTYSRMLHTQQGCDSVLNLSLVVNNPSTSVVTESIVENQLPWTYRSATFYDVVTDTIFHDVNAYGCDSIIHYSLLVFRNVSAAVDSSVCSSQLPFTWNGVVFSQFGTHTVTLTSSLGADSLLAMTLLQLSNSSSYVSDTVNENQLPIVFNGVSFNDEVTNHPIVLTNYLGCDSTIYFSLHVNWNSSTVVDSSICADLLPFTWNGVTFTEAGRQTITLSDQAGADSVVIMRLVVHPTYQISIADTLCSPQSYWFVDSAYSALGVYSRSLTSSDGCDSIVTLSLQVNNPSSSVVSDTIFQRQLPYTFNSVVFPDSVSNSQVVIPNSAGCDSTISYSLFVHRNTYTSFDSVICDSQLPLLWGNSSFTQAGTRVDTLLAANGADSIVTRRLVVNPTFSTAVNAVACDDQKFPFLDTVYDHSGTYPHHLLSINGCDSLLTLHLIVNQVTYSVVSESVVENQLPYTYHGNAFSGPVTDTMIFLTNAAGCDSLVTYSLSVYWNISSSVDSSVCSTDLPLVWNGTTFTQSATHSATLTASNGADSVVTMTLQVRQSTESWIFDTVVENLLPRYFNGHSFSSAVTNEPIVLTNSEGCDSLIHYSLFVHLNHTYTYDSVVCANHLPLIWDGATFYEAGQSQSTYIAHSGADSLVIRRLSVLPVADTAISGAICSGQTFHVGSYSYNYAGDYQVLLRAANGCDSTVNLHLVQSPSYNLIISDTICDNQHYRFGDTLILQPGSYTSTFTTIQGCDSTVTLILRVFPTFASISEELLCERGSFTWIDGNTYFSSTDSPSVVLAASNGCDSSVTLHLNIDPAPLASFRVEPDRPTYEHHLLRLVDQSVNSVSRTWIAPDEISYSEVFSYDYPVREDSVVISLIAISEHGCADTASQTIRMEHVSIYAPNAFTPRGDFNSHFRIFGHEVDNVEVYIYNRSGLLVCHYSGLDGSWDGTHNGQLCPEASYVYIVRYTSIHQPSNPLTIKGTVLLIR